MKLGIKVEVDQRKMALKFESNPSLTSKMQNSSIALGALLILYEEKKYSKMKLN